MIKVIIVLTIGALLSRNNILTVASSKSLSTILLFVGYPCLIVSSIVSTLNVGNVSALLYLAVSVVFYIVLGLMIGGIIRMLVSVPVNLKRTVLMTLSMCNWGDLSLAVVMGIAKESPFSSGDDLVGASFVVLFCAVANFYFYTVGWYMIGKDVREAEEIPSIVDVSVVGNESITFVSLPQKGINRFREFVDRDPRRKMVWTAISHPCTISV